MMIDHTSLNAQPENEDFSGKYKNEGIIAKYLVNNYFKAVERLISKTKNTESSHEIGIGEGRSTMRLKKMAVGLSGSEYVDYMVRIARKNNPDLNIFQESVYELKHENKSVDLVFLLEVLEHLDYPELALKEIKRISKRYLILGVPREPLWKLLNICRFKYVKKLGNTPGHLNHWSRKEIVKLIEANFGKVIAVETPIPWIIVLAKKNGTQ
ncbi:class I SAM-dependent methyltransferase [Tamlana sp. 2201CG12-4]|uniref:class I SAM-dependent methyltransferase n=1 Tax=Tamlana sp. 2201CG12-4 TaxID=3112582 RepID=UPI002DB6AEB9|nr:class I SAM-dependent methyltransferase [Tamlana sp. 2201CG12-4]MEC3907352.1 class I SAM-dependent methyltransferase [Tamlana sp. 2201CG12-4]